MANFRQIGTDFTNGLRAPYYTNGRLLTAEDLETGQQSALERTALSGRGAGMGIIEGFNVTATANRSSLTVTAGLGLNGKGDAVQLLAAAVTLPVQPITDDSQTIRRSSRFGECDGDGEAATTPLDEGAYLLTVVPLARLEGSVPRQACDGTETATCANQWEREGLEFKIIRLTNYQAPTGSRANRNRNLLAHWFYGSAALGTLMLDPFQFDANYTGYGEIAAPDFTTCDLPLAVFFWRGGRIDFVDEWSVRRPLVHATPTATWFANLSDQRKAEGEARFLQFQAQVADLQSSFGTKVSLQKAVTHFGYLPPVGFLPVNPFELIYTDIFLKALTANDNELLNEIRRRELATLDVFKRMQTMVLGTFENNHLYRLENFFTDLLPAAYQVVHEDLIHDRLHQSWVQPAITLPSPPALVGSELVAEFAFVTALGERVTIAPERIDAVFTGVIPTLSSVKLAQTIADRLTRPVAIDRDPLITRPGLDEANRPTPRAATAVVGKNGADPLVDIWVMDELLAPYHKLLTAEMPDIIRGAIISLSSGGGIFVGSNRFTAVSREINQRFVTNAFFAQAVTRGVGYYTDLLQFVNQAKAPFFYVAFVRHRPEVVSRPLILPDLDG